LKISGRALYQLFKYSIYGLLTINVFVFFGEELLATRLEFPDGVAPRDFFMAYAATIDTAAWVILLLMFELETWVLEDRHFTRAVSWSLHALRAICYLFILSAFYGYVVDAIFVYQTLPLASVTDLCRLAGQQAVVDAPGLADIRFLAWVDVVNAAVWLLVVLLLEVDVQLQEHNLYEGLAFFLSTVAKIVLYSILAVAVVIWAVKGDFVDWWDALLWLVAFVFIELNVFEWRQKSHETQS
jgi:hypothetical protein